MNIFLITDTHFGIKQNSITWLNSQVSFIENEFIPILKKYPNSIVIHLGDVFDSRSSVSTWIAYKVVRLFDKIRENCSKFVIIGGNHDYYSPTQDTVDTISLFFDPTKYTIITKNYLIDDDRIYIPWYCWQDKQEEMLNIIAASDVKYVFLHTDLEHDQIPNSFSNIQFYSGHIHTPQKISKNKLILGSCYATSMADANQERGFYHLTEDNNCIFYPNNSSIKFWRLYDPEFKYTDTFKPIDYFEIYLSSENLLNTDYLHELSIFLQKFSNCKVLPKDNGNIDTTLLKQYSGCNIDHVLDELIPDNLKDKLNIIRNNSVV